MRKVVKRTKAGRIAKRSARKQTTKRKATTIGRRRKPRDQDRCRICEQVYSLPASMVTNARRKGEYWVCPSRHPQFPDSSVDRRIVERVLNRVLSDNERERTEQSELLTRIEKLEEEKEELSRLNKSLLERAEKNEVYRPPSKQLRTCESVLSRTKKHAEELEERMKALLSNSRGALRQAAADARASATNAVFAELYLGSCPTLGCPFKFESLNELLDHARVAHTSVKHPSGG